MADDKEEGNPSLTVDDALKMYERYKSFWKDNYTEANIDLKMAAGDPATHWGDVYLARKKAQQLTMVINELPQFIHQVTNDIRQNTPSVSTIPDSDGDIETAEVYSDLIRDIEYKSSADEAYDTGAEYAVKCAIGFIRVDHDYVSDDSDEQELQIKKVHDPLSVWIDPASIECDGRDANGGIALEPISRRDFERLYPKKSFISFVDPKNTDHKEDSIVIAEIFVREFVGKHGKTPIIRRYKFSGSDMLGETTFPGDYVPIVPVIGEDVWIDGRRILASLIRQSRDPQLRLNHWACKEQQILNMAPIAPVMAVEGTLVNERNQWQSPGTEMVLEYRAKDLDDNPAPPPQRLNPPPVPTGILNAMEGAKQNIKESLGMYNASIGEKSNETSGVAIQRRQHEGDVATFHFPDNVRRSITQVGRILASAIPIIYETPRTIQTMSTESEPKMVAINGAPMVRGQKQAHDLTKGKYRVRVTTGASYTTRRQEEAEFLSNIAQRDPNFMGVGGDILFKSMDTPGAQALAARYKKLIDPKLLEDTQDPQVVALTQKLGEMQKIIQQGAQEIQQLQGELQNKQGEQQLKLQELQIKAAELQKPQEGTDPIDIAKLQLEKEKEDREFVLKQRELAVKEFDAETKRIQATQKQPDGTQSMGIKVDTTGFQMMKTPEQDALESQQFEMQSQADAEEKVKEDAESLLKAQQAQAVIDSLGVIAQQLSQIAVNASQPIDVIRDENGAIIGAR